MTNPLLNLVDLPPFSAIKPEHVEPDIDPFLTVNLSAMSSLLKGSEEKTWDNLVVPMEDLEDRLTRAWSPVSHMNSVLNSNELRDAYNACLPKLSQYATELGQNETLYAAFEHIASNVDKTQELNTSQQKAIDNALRDFRLSGVGLSDDQKTRFMEVKQELSTLTGLRARYVLIVDGEILIPDHPPKAPIRR